MSGADIDPLLSEMAGTEPLSTFDISEYLNLLRRRWRLIALISVVSIAAGVALYAVTPRQYLARTTIQIEQRSPMSATGQQNPWWDAWLGIKYYPTQYRLLTSRGLAERVVDNLGLLSVDGVDEPPALAAARARRANQLLGGLQINPVADTELVELSYVDIEPTRAARVVNGFAEAFIDWGIETRTDSVGKASRFLESQIDSLRVEVDDKEQQLQTYSRDTDIVNVDPGSNVTLQRLERLNQDYIAALGERLEREALYNQLMSAEPQAVADRQLGGLVNELTRDQVQLERDYEAKLRTYKPEWPEMVELRSQIEEGRAHLDTVVGDQAQKARRKAYADYQTALRRESSLDAEIRKVKAEAMNLSVAAVEFKNLEMEIDNRRELLDQLLRRLSEAGMTARLQSTRESNVRIIDQAIVPRSPFRPSLTRNVTTGAGLGLALGVALVLLLHYMDRTIKSADELERLLGIPTLAVIPDVNDSGTGYGYTSYASDAQKGTRRRRKKAAADEIASIELIPETRPRLAVSEAYRALRTALLLSSAEALRVVTITSAEAGEGKTATAANLAVVMAQLGRRVLLVDADLRKPRVHQVMQVSNRVGLVSFLTHGAEPEQIFQTSSVANLTVCTSGPHPPNPSELLASERMSAFLEMARSRFDLVVVDTPPVLAVTDAIIAGSRSDGVVLCLRANKVPREHAISCRDRLRLNDVRLLGAVLNRYRAGSGGYYDRGYLYYDAYVDEPRDGSASSAA